MLEINKVHCGDSIEVLKTLPDESIDMVITSPPYWALRCYLPDKVKLKSNLTEKEITTLKKELTLLGLDDTIRV